MWRINDVDGVQARDDEEEQIKRRELRKEFVQNGRKETKETNRIKKSNKSESF